MVKEYTQEWWAEEITVCDECFMACCWQGIFMCSGSAAAGTTHKTRAELAVMNYENSQFWKTDKELL